MDIRRDFYLNKLIKRKNNGLIKVITGIRRCGKSYLLNNLFYHHLLDEVQMLDCFVSVLNGYLRKENMDVFVTGSNAKLLSKDVATEFAGRGDEVHMYPLSFAEFMTVYPGDKYMGLSEYMLYGGILLVVLREDPKDKVIALQNLFNEIYIRDITTRNRVKNISELEDLLNILSSSIGSLTNPEKLRNTFKSVKKIQNHSCHYQKISRIF